MQELVNNESRQSRRTGKTRQKLLHAARELFAEKGLDSTRIDEITDRADVGKGTFYYHFNTKEKLVQELMRSVLGELQARIEDGCREIDNLEDLLDSIIQCHLDFFNNRWEDFVLFFQGRVDLTLEKGYEGIEEPFLTYLNTIETLLDAVIRHHLSRKVLRRLTCAVAGFVSGYYSFSSIVHGRDELERAFHPLREVLVKSLTHFIRESIPDESYS